MLQAMITVSFLMEDYYDKRDEKARCHGGDVA